MSNGKLLVIMNDFVFAYVFCFSIVHITLRSKHYFKNLKKKNFTINLTVIKATRFWHEDRHVDQWNRQPRNKPSCIRSKWFLTKLSRPMKGEKGESFNKWYWEMISICKRMKLDPYLSHIQKVTQNRSNTRRKQHKSFLPLNVLMISWIWHQRYRLQKIHWTSRKL